MCFGLPRLLQRMKENNGAVWRLHRLRFWVFRTYFSWSFAWIDPNFFKLKNQLITAIYSELFFNTHTNIKHVLGMVFEHDDVHKIFGFHFVLGNNFPAKSLRTPKVWGTTANDDIVHGFWKLERSEQHNLRHDTFMSWKAVNFRGPGQESFYWRKRSPFRKSYLASHQGSLWLPQLRSK